MSFCEGLNVLIVNKLFNFTEASGKVFIRNFKKYGGNAEAYNGTQAIKRFSHLIVPSKMPKSSLESLLSIKVDSFNIPITTEAWPTQMFSKKCWVDPLIYKWKDSEKEVLKRKQEVKTPPKKIRPDMIESSSRNLNFHLTNELEKLKNFYEVVNDKGRTIVYGNIIRTLRLLPFKVEKIEQIKEIEGFGEKSLNKVREILEKGGLDRVQNFNMNERITAMKNLTEVHGIGTNLAYKLFKKGITTYDMLLKFAIENPGFFNETQKTSIQLHNEIQLKIPRNEVSEIANFVIKSLTSMDKNAKFEVCGSFRRGRELCGDVDIVISTEIDNLLLELVQNCSIITHIFSLSNHKFIGVCKLGTHQRRLDIYCCKPPEFWFAVLYFTGSSNYNRLLRAAAGKSNLHLSNTNLTDLRSGRPVLEAKSEEDIIAFLGFPILSLQERDI